MPSRGVPLPALNEIRVLVDNAPVLRENQPDLRGPLLGLATGLAASDAEWCFLAACDMPFLKGSVILDMALELKECDALVMSVGGHVQPFHAFYARHCLPKAEALLEQGITSLRALLDMSNARVMTGEDVPAARNADFPLWDIDTPEE